MTPSPEPEAFLPLSSQVYGILLVLADRTLHGFGIIEEFERRTGQTDVLLPGSLYNTLSRMSGRGLVEEADPPPGEADDRRRFYTSTELGRRVARAESLRLRSLLDLARDQGLEGEAAT